MSDDLVISEAIIKSCQDDFREIRKRRFRLTGQQFYISRQHKKRKYMDLPIQAKEKGFTFFEVIFITAILSLGLLTIIEIFPLGFKAKEAAEQHSITALLGQKIIEEVKREGYESLSSPSLSQSENGGIREGEFEDYQGYRYRLEWWDSETPYLLKLKVTILLNNSEIESKEREGNTKNYPNNEDNSWQCLDLVTYLAKKD
ncbi:hypothetical protein LCGC14_2240820 [marine sediment metagenome]|uniref:Type II secretion system protein GspI C-terminal domain-containing protein n=1 Tax=marine sediment metagenome TaxID=412755 RepID=A0A0F9G0I7_9ZZZZ